MDENAWLQRLASMGGGNLQRHIEALMLEVAPGLSLMDRQFRAEQLPSGHFQWNLLAGPDYLEQVAGSAADPRLAGAAFLVAFESWARTTGLAVPPYSD